MIKKDRKSVVFDWDGVVIDSSRLHEKSWEWMADEYALVLPEGHFRRGFGMKNERIIPEVLGWATDIHEIRELAARKETRYRELVMEEGLEPLPGVGPWLERLNAGGISCAIASSTDRANIDCVLERIGFGRFFKAIVSGDEVRHGKPAPDIFQKAAAKLGGLPSIVFEDALVGIEAAHRAGMAVVAVTTTHPAHELGAAEKVVARLDDLTLDEAQSLALTGWRATA